MPNFLKTYFQLDPKMISEGSRQNSEFKVRLGRHMSIESSTYKDDGSASGYKLVQHISDVFSILAAAYRALLSVF